MHSSCLLCGSELLRDLSPNSRLEGATTRADKLHKFHLVQCSACGHVQKSVDQAWEDAMSGLYTEDYGATKVAGRQIEVVNGQVIDRVTAVVSKLDEAISLGEVGSLLDMGCGTGAFLSAFAREKPNWSIAGFDVGNIHAEDITSIPGAKFYSKSIDAIKGQFDVIMLSHVLEHLTDPIGMLRKAADLLSPTGHLIIRVPCFLAANADFFILEHCSHFVPETLAFALSQSGLHIHSVLSGLAAIEIGYVAQKGTSSAHTQPDSQAIQRETLRCLNWAESLPLFVRDNAKGRKIGIFGVGGAGIWLGTYLRGEMSFFVDDDPGKQGHSFAGCPIISSRNVPEDAIVFVTLNNPEAAARIAGRLQKENPTRAFLAPPVVEKSAHDH